MTDQKEIPLYTRIGGNLTIIILLILTVILLKNCIGAVLYGTSTNEEAIQQHYDLGYTNGTRQAKGNITVEEIKIENPMLKKAYHQGFRKGWDSVYNKSKEEGGIKKQEVSPKQ